MGNNLIICADDYAMSADIDAGILSLIALGRLTAASCLTLSPRWPQAAKEINPAIRDGADIGLHLDFTGYSQAMHHPLPLLIARTLARRLDKKAIRDSINHQLDRFEDALGKSPDYIDGHQHVHQLPQIRDQLISVLSERYAGNLPWIRIAKPPLEDGWKGWLIRQLGAEALARNAKAAGFRCSSTLLGVYGFDGDSNDYKLKLSNWLASASRSGETMVLMCHPALHTSEVSMSEPADPIRRARLREYEVLSSNDLDDLLKRNSIRLVRGKALPCA